MVALGPYRRSDTALLHATAVGAPLRDGLVAVATVEVAGWRAGPGDILRRAPGALKLAGVSPP
jgi:hypothetical protein